MTDLSIRLGLCLTFVALSISNSPQPALLYLVPCTLIAVVLVGWRRGELKALWNGPETQMSITVEEMQGLRVMDDDEDIPL